MTWRFIRIRAAAATTISTATASGVETAGLRSAARARPNVRACRSSGRSITGRMLRGCLVGDAAAVLLEPLLEQGEPLGESRVLLRELGDDRRVVQQHEQDECRCDHEQR